MDPVSRLPCLRFLVGLPQQQHPASAQEIRGHEECNAVIFIPLTSFQLGYSIRN